MSDRENRDIYWQPSWIMVFGMLITFSIVFLILPAGRLDWEKGWAYIILLFIYTVIAIFYLKWVNPEIFSARRRLHPGTKFWDKILLCFLMPPFFAVFLVAALDDGRFHWSDVPLSLIGAGYALFAFGLSLFTWAEGVNRFFEPGVRIQSDRGHHVIENGPYAFVRHPGYIGGILYLMGTALALGSFLALVPAMLTALTLIVRTIWEDQTLQKELPGYKEYCQKVRYRMIPYIW